MLNCQRACITHKYRDRMLCIQFIYTQLCCHTRNYFSLLALRLRMSWLLCTYVNMLKIYRSLPQTLVPIFFLFVFLHFLLLLMQCNGRGNDTQRISWTHKVWKQAISIYPCSCARVCYTFEQVLHFCYRLPLSVSCCCCSFLFVVWLALVKKNTGNIIVEATSRATTNWKRKRERNSQTDRYTRKIRQNNKIVSARWAFVCIQQWVNFGCQCLYSLRNECTACTLQYYIYIYSVCITTTLVDRLIHCCQIRLPCQC